MNVGKLIELLSVLPSDREVKIATQNPKYHDDIGMDNIWGLNGNQKPRAGRKSVMLIAKRKSSKQLKQEGELGLV